MTDKSDALTLAIRFHETYERLAPSFGYETRADTKTFDPESKNGRLMVAVCAALASPPTGAPSTLRESAGERAKFEERFSSCESRINRKNFRMTDEGHYAEERIDAMWQGWEARAESAPPRAASEPKADREALARRLCAVYCNGVEVYFDQMSDQGRANWCRVADVALSNKDAS